jgi:hypothetical protein
MRDILTPQMAEDARAVLLRQWADALALVTEIGQT